MVETTLILGLEGQVWLTDFTSAMTHFQELVEALCEHLDREAVVHWEVVDLKAGSTSTTIQGSALDREFLTQVSNAFMAIGQHMQRGQTIPYPYPVIQPATQLTHVINGRITAVRFATAETSITIETRVPSPGRAGRLVSYGEVRGTVETLQRRQHRFRTVRLLTVAMKLPRPLISRLQRGLLRDKCDSNFPSGPYAVRRVV